MASTIRDYSATAASNTTVDGADISEGCSPAGINDAIRGVMADLKDVSTGAVSLESPAADSLSLSGALTTTSTIDGRDVAADGAKLDLIDNGANNYVHPNHTGEVTSTADGATVIADNVVDEANLKVSNAPTNGYALTAQSGAAGGLTWAAIASGGGGDLLAANNLSDLDNAATARTNLGLGTAATTASTDYATAAQGTTADAALPRTGGAMTGAITTNSTFDGRDVATDGAKLDLIDNFANNYIHPNHTGEVTSTADGATVIADNVVDEANLKVSNAPTNGYALTAQSGAAGGLTWAAVSGGSYTDSDVDTHLNTGTAATNEVLSWNGTDYDWVVSGGSGTQQTENVGTISSGTLDLSTGNVFSDAPAANVTYVFNNPPSSGTAYGFTLKVTPSGTYTVTWPASVDWAGGTAPTAPASGETDVFTFYTQDGGTTYYGFQAGDAMG